MSVYFSLGQSIARLKCLLELLEGLLGQRMLVLVWVQKHYYLFIVLLSHGSLFVVKLSLDASWRSTDVLVDHEHLLALIGKIWVLSDPLLLLVAGLYLYLVDKLLMVLAVVCETEVEV